MNVCIPCKNGRHNCLGLDCECICPSYEVIISLCPECSDLVSPLIDIALNQMNSCKKCKGRGYVEDSGK